MQHLNIIARMIFKKNEKTSKIKQLSYTNNLSNGSGTSNLVVYKKNFKSNISKQLEGQINLSYPVYL